jgi:hypothetical protein
VFRAEVCCGDFVGVELMVLDVFVFWTCLCYDVSLFCVLLDLIVGQVMLNIMFW